MSGLRGFLGAARRKPRGPRWSPNAKLLGVVFLLQAVEFLALAVDLLLLV
jgi:hypothetical protein